MAGIFGIYRFDDRPVDRALVACMSESLAHKGPDGEGIAIDGAFAIGCRQLRVTPESMRERQPVVRASGTRLVFDGRLDNRADLIAELREHCDVSINTPDAELASWSCEMAGVEFVRHLLGDFAVAVFEPRARRVLLARDAMGVRLLYYRQQAAFVMFASEIKAFFADRDFHVRPNDQLLAELVLRQVHRRRSDGSTLFSDVRQVPPGHVGVFTASRLHMRRYWDFDLHASPSHVSFADCADEFRHLFRRAVQRRLRSTHPVAIAVSGGLDSSAIFCTACKSAPHAALAGLTYTSRDGSPSDESIFVAEIERACGRPIEQVDTPFEGVLFRSAEVIRWTEAPMLDGQWFRGDRLMRAVTSRHAKTLLSGHWGDQLLFDQAYLVDLLCAGTWRAIGTHLREYRQWFPDAVGDEFAGQFRADLLEYVLPRWVRLVVRASRRGWHGVPPWEAWYTDRFRGEARPDVFTYPAIRHDTRALTRALYREVRSQYHDLCLEWNNKAAARYGVEPAFPFLDRDLVDFLMRQPGDVLVRDGVPKALLRRALEDIVPREILERRTKADFTQDVNHSTRQDFPELVKLLGSDARVVERGYVDADKLKRGLTAIGPALEGSQSSSIVSWRVTAVVALEIWLRHFIGTTAGGRTLHEQTSAS